MLRANYNKPSYLTPKKSLGFTENKDETIARIHDEIATLENMARAIRPTLPKQFEEIGVNLFDPEVVPDLQTVAIASQILSRPEQVKQENIKTVIIAHGDTSAKNEWEWGIQYRPDGKNGEQYFVPAYYAAHRLSDPGETVLIAACKPNGQTIEPAMRDFNDDLMDKFIRYKHADKFLPAAND